MTDAGAITLMIEAAEETHRELRFWHRNSKDGVKTSAALQQSEKALKALKAFKDEVPDGLGDNVENIIIHNQYIETKEVKADIMVFYKAAKHLQKGIK